MKKDSFFLKNKYKYQILKNIYEWKAEWTAWDSERMFWLNRFLPTHIKNIKDKKELAKMIVFIKSYVKFDLHNKEVYDFLGVAEKHYTEKTPESSKINFETKAIRVKTREAMEKIFDWDKIHSDCIFYYGMHKEKINSTFWLGSILISSFSLLISLVVLIVTLK